MEWGSINVERSWSGEVSMLRDHGVGKYQCNTLVQRRIATLISPLV